MGTKGGGAVIVHKARLLIAWGGRGEARAPVLALHTIKRHVGFSFSYLRFAEAASFDKKSYVGAVHPYSNFLKKKFLGHFSIF